MDKKIKLNTNLAQRHANLKAKTAPKKAAPKQRMISAAAKLSPRAREFALAAARKLEV